MPAAQQLLRESVEQNNLQVDSDAGVIRGVKILSPESKHGYRYTDEAMREAMSMYEGMRVNIDHPDKAEQRRSWRDRIGRLVNITREPDGLRGDLHYNPAHPYGPALAWAAKHQPETLGLSHTAFGRHATQNGQHVIDKIVKVQSVDLVADPATNKTLYESMETEAPVVDTPDAGEEGYEAQIGHLVVAILKDDDLDLAAKKKKILTALKLMDDGQEQADDEEAEGDEPEHDEEEEQEESVDPKVELARLQAEKKARLLCESMKVPVTEAFIESLALLGDEKRIKALIEDRKAIVNKPRSHAPAPANMKLEDFAAALKR